MSDVPEASSPKPSPVDPKREGIAANSRPTASPGTPPTRPAKKSPLTIFLSVLCAVLVITVIVLWGKLGIRDKTIEQKTNRTEQLQTGATNLQSEVDQAKAETARVQKQLDEATTASAQLKTDLDKSKADSVDLQSQLDKARKSATDFQTQMAEAKVASLKRQGEVEVAQAQTSVMQTQLNKAKSDLTQAQAQLTEANAKTTDLQEKLEKAEQTILSLSKPPAKK